MVESLPGGGSALIMEYLNFSHGDTDSALGEGLARYVYVCYLFFLDIFANCCLVLQVSSWFC